MGDVEEGGNETTKMKGRYGRRRGTELYKLVGRKVRMRGKEGTE